MAYSEENLVLRVQQIPSVNSCQALRREDELLMTPEEREKGEASHLTRLIERSQEGDIQAMEALFEHFKGSLFNLIYRFTYDYHIAEDLLQETFLKVFTHIQDVENVDFFKSWLYRIAVNTCYSYLRGNRARREKTVSMSEMEWGISENVDETQHKDLKDKLEMAIQKLAPKLKSVFILHDVQGFKHDEIARLLGWATGTSKSQLFKARMRIRAYLKSH